MKFLDDLEWFVDEYVPIWLQLVIVIPFAIPSMLILSVLGLISWCIVNTILYNGKN